VVAKERAEVSWLGGVESVMSQCGKFEIDADVLKLVYVKPVLSHDKQH